MHRSRVPLRTCLAPRNLITAPRLARTYARASTDAIQNLYSRCQCCGSPFHESGNIKEPGHRILKQLKQTGSIKKIKNSSFDELFNSLSEEKKKFLQQETLETSDVDTEPSKIQWTTSTADSIAKSEADLHRKHKQNDMNLMCKRCFNISNGSHKSEEISLPTMSRDELLDSIPQDATIVHVINALDFPASLYRPISNRKNVFYVINKVDLISGRKKSINFERALPYFQQEVARSLSVSPDKVMVVSARKGWGLEKLYNSIGPESYLFGYTNSGKTHLALEMARLFKGSTPVGHRPQRQLSRTAYPWMTQSPFTYELSDKKLLTDLPSIPEQKSIWHILKPELRKSVVEGRELFKEPGAYKAFKPVVLSKPNHILSLGGLVTIKRSNPELHLITWVIAGAAGQTARVFSSMDKIAHWSSMEKDSLPLEQQKMCDQFYHFPEHAGQYGGSTGTTKEFTFGAAGLTLAIRGLGIVHMHFYGKIPEGGDRVQVEVMKGISIEKRSNVLPFLRSTTGKKAPELKDERLQEHRMGIKKVRYERRNVGKAASRTKESISQVLSRQDQ